MRVQYMWMLWVSLLCLLLTPSRGQEEDAGTLIYYMAEENDPNQPLGNVFIDGGWNLVYDAAQLADMDFQFLSSSSEYSSYFSIAGDGALEASSVIDRDSICASLDVCTIALDISMRGSLTFEIIKVNVVIVDINDNAPMFAISPIQRSISEAAVPGVFINLPTAQDPDSPANSIQSYTLQSSYTTFDLVVEEESQSVRLVLQESLDRETQAFYQVQVAAIDGGDPPQSGFMTVNIEVLDVNDHSPVFDNTTYETFISENLPLYTVVIVVNAVDQDSGESGEVQYSLDDETEADYGEIFGIDAVTGEIYTKVRLDYEEQHQYKLTVIAEDRSPDSLPSFATVIVNVWDLNDHFPLIIINTDAPDGSVSILEGVPVGSFVAHITVEDADGGDNGDFQCSLDNTSSFELQQLFDTEYKIVSLVPFDREAQSVYNMAIVCQDFGTPQQMSTEQITVHIGDANDHAPEFDPSFYEVAVAEDQSPSLPILQVYATDGDIEENGRIVYTIDSQSQAVFHINSSSGEVFGDNLDYETSAFHSITVTATDQSEPFWSSEATVLITVLDADDNAPQFTSNPFVFQVRENLPSDTFVGQINATDPDGEPYNDFTYSLDASSNQSSNFRIDVITGRIFTTVPLDRESNALQHIVVIARGTAGNFLENRTHVYISVLDENDNAPIIIYPTEGNNTVYIMSNISLGYVVARIMVSDEDTDANGNILYEITGGNTGNVFRIDQDTGAVLLSKSLEDYEETTFDLDISVSDGGVPPHTVTTQFHFMVNASATGAGIISSNNLTIVVTIACISAILIIVLVIAIYAVIKKQRRNKHKKKYNYAARVADQKLVASQQHSQKGQDNPDITKDAPPNGILKKPNPKDLMYSKPGKRTSNIDQANYEVQRDSSSDYPSMGDVSTDGSTKPFVNFERMPPNSSDLWLNARYPADVVPHVIYPVQHIDQRAWHPPSQKANKPPDTESICSADVSNADSGRGSNDDGSENHIGRAGSPQGGISPPISPLKTKPPIISTRGLHHGVHAGMKRGRGPPPPPPPPHPILRTSARKPKDVAFDPRRSHGDLDMRDGIPLVERNAWKPGSSAPNVVPSNPRPTYIAVKNPAGGYSLASNV